MRTNKINLFNVGAWLYFAGLALVFLCVLIPGIPTDPAADIVSWLWAVSVTVILSNFISKIVTKSRKRIEEPEEELKNDE